MEKQIIKPRDNFAFFGGLSLLYGVIFAGCLYRNVMGITFPICIIVTIIVAIQLVKRMNGKWNVKSWPYFGAILLLGGANALTTNYFFILFNIAGIILLFTIGMFQQFYDDRMWNFGTYVKRLLFFFGHCIVSIASPFQDGAKFFTEKKAGKNKVIMEVLIGVGIACGLLLVILPLLISSDMIFAKVFGEVFQHIMVSSIFWIGCTILLGTVACYAFTNALSLRNLSSGNNSKTHIVNPITGITFTAIISVIYLIYSGIQLTYLFVGLKSGLPKGVTYSQYAHTGFWQLLFVSIINFLMVLICINIFQKHRVLQGILTAISLCTFIMIISAAYRMLLYIEEYNLTFLRVLVLWFLIVLTFIMVGTLILVYKRKFLLFRYSVVIVTTFYIILSYAQPDYFIARYNVLQAEQVNVNDVEYMIYGLSQDAAPAVADINIEEVVYTASVYRTKDELEGEIRAYFQNIVRQYKKIPIRELNASKIRAKQAAEQYLEK